jgi:reactive intermediate/imine deaminase
VRAGSSVYISGQLGLEPGSNFLSPNFVGQATQAFKNIEAILKEADIRLDNVVKFTIFMTDLSNFEDLNELMGKLFINDYFPARSVVEASRLPKNALIEIDAIASH